MSVADGQRVNAAVTNAAFVSRTVNTSTVGKLDLSNADAASGTSIVNSQRELNSLASFIGKSVNQIYNFLPTWASNVIGLSSDTMKARVEAIQVIVETLNGSSSGGGGSIFWVEDEGSPLTAVENNIRVYSYQNGLTQYLYSLIKVPAGYLSSSQINMKLNFYSNDTSGNVLLKVLSTLIQTGTSTISSTINQHTSINTAVTLSGGTQNIPQSITFDLTDGSGAINSISVAAGDFIKIQLYRDTDTATSDVKVPVYGADFTF